MTSTKYIGMDVHKESISSAVMNASGKIVMECELPGCRPEVARPVNTSALLGSKREAKTPPPASLLCLKWRT